MLQVFQMARGAKAEMSEELTVIEIKRLDEYEAVIERGLKTFNQVGSILMAIRDERLYRTEYGTFEDYCRERWGMSKAYAHRMIASSEVVSNLSPIGDIPQTESQARPLAKLPPEQQADAWTAAVEKAKDEGRKVTAKDVEMEVEIIVKPKQQKEVQIDPLSGRVEVIDIDAKDEQNAEPPNLAGLKRYWNYANKRERKAFLQYIKEEGRL
jgi:hypothetical protein